MHVINNEQESTTLTKCPHLEEVRGDVYETRKGADCATHVHPLVTDEQRRVHRAGNHDAFLCVVSSVILRGSDVCFAGLRMRTSN